MGNTLKISYPFKFLTISQKWNNPDPAAYQQFGFKNHNGLDLISGYANQNGVYAPKTWPVYCPVENFTVHMKRYSPQGGGNEFWMLSNTKLQLGDKECYAYLGFAHAEKVFVEVGDQPALGEMLSIQDSTGFSTGSHLHLGLYRVDWDGKNMTFLDQNDANGSYDPTLFWTGIYAVDQADLATLIKSNLRYYKYKAGF